jgi:hypothetical protein
LARRSTPKHNLLLCTWDGPLYDSSGQCSDDHRVTPGVQNDHVLRLTRPATNKILVNDLHLTFRDSTMNLWVFIRGHPADEPMWTLAAIGCGWVERRLHIPRRSPGGFRTQAAEWAHICLCPPADFSSLRPFTFPCAIWFGHLTDGGNGCWPACHRTDLRRQRSNGKNTAPRGDHFPGGGRILGSRRGALCLHKIHELR